MIGNKVLGPDCLSNAEPMDWQLFNKEKAELLNSYFVSVCTIDKWNSSSPSGPSIGWE